MKAAIALLVAALASVVAFVLITQEPGGAAGDDGMSRSSSGPARGPGAPGADPLESVSDGADAVGSRSADAVAEPGAADPVAVPGAAGPVEEVPRAVVVGRITDASGAPITGADVRAHADAFAPAGSEGRPRSAPADADGRFRIELEPGRITLVAGADGHAPLDRPIDAAPGETVDAGELRLAPGVVLSGRVVDERGAPVEGAELRRPLTLASGFVATGGAANVVAVTDAEGQFTLERQPHGAFDLEVAHRSYPSGRLRGRTERPGERLAGLEVVLEVGATISGRVTGLDGLEPAERGRLRVLASLAVDADGNERAAGRSSHPGRRATPDADGTFVLRGLDAGASYDLQVQDSGSFFGARGRRSESVAATGGDRGVLVPYDDGPRLRFRLAADDGAPIEGAEVRVGHGWLEPVDAAVADDPGAYEVASLWPDGSGTPPSLAIAARGFEAHETEALPLRGTADVDLGTIVLERRPQLVVTVLDGRTGAPIEDARVEVSDAPAAGGSVEAGFQVRSITVGGAPAADDPARTDGGGRATLDVTPGDRVVVDVKHPAYAEVRLGPIDLAPDGAPYALEARLDVGATVVVHLVDGEGRPVPGRGVERRRTPGGPDPDDEEADDAGVATFRGLPAGTHGFAVAGRRAAAGGVLVALGSLGEAAAPPSRAWTEVEVALGETVEVELLAPTPSAIAGVVTERGEPLAGAQVEFVPQSGGESNPGLRIISPGSDGATATTDARGEFRIEGLDPGPGELSISHSSRAMPNVSPFEVEPGENEAALDLDVTIAAGVVHGPDGEPLAGARVTAEKKRSDGETRSSFSVVMQSADGVVRYDSGSAGAEPAVTDAEGRYELRGVQAGVRLEAVARHGDLEAARSAPFEVGPGGRRTGVDIDFPVPGAIEITFPGNEGAAIAVLHQGGAVARTRPFSGETVIVGDLAPGTYSVSVTSLADSNAVISAGAEDASVEVLSGRTARYTHE